MEIRRLNLKLGHVTTFKLSKSERYLGAVGLDFLKIIDLQDEIIVYSRDARCVDFDFIGDEPSTIILITSFVNQEEKLDRIILLDFIQGIDLRSEHLLDQVTSVSHYKDGLIIIGLIPEDRKSPEYSIKVFDLELNERNVGFKFPSVKSMETSLPHKDFPAKITYFAHDHIAVMGHYASLIINSDTIVFDEQEHDFISEEIYPGNLISYESTDISISQNGLFAAISFGGTINSETPKLYVFDLVSKQGIGWYIRRVETIEKVRISKDGNYVAASYMEKGNKRIKIVELKQQTDIDIKVFEDYHDAVFSSKNERLIYLCSHEFVDVFQIPRPRPT